MAERSLDRDDTAQCLLVPAPLQGHANPILKLVSCSRSLAKILGHPHFIVVLPELTVDQLDLCICYLTVEHALLVLMAD